MEKVGMRYPQYRTKAETRTDASLAATSYEEHKLPKNLKNVASAKYPAKTKR
jgi:hypothetical protein